MWKKVRKKPVEVKAFEFTKEHSQKCHQFGRLFLAGVYFDFNEKTRKIEVQTLEGKHDVTIGDWIIEGIKGEHYPCKPDIFEKTYDVIEDYETA